MTYQVPHNYLAEQSVIGGLLIDPQGENAQQVFSLISPDDFYSHHHSEIYAQMRVMNSRREPIDIITLSDRITKCGKNESTGGLAYLAEIAKNVPSAANIVNYAKSIKDCALSRYTIEKAKEIQRLFTENTLMQFSEKINIAQRLIDDAANFGKTGQKTGLRRIDDVVDDVFTEICERQDDPVKHRGLKTGFQHLDELFAPKQIMAGSLFVIGARPKMGKTTVLTEMAKNVSRQDKSVLLFSMEMTEKQIVERSLSQQSNINSDRFYEKLEQQEWDMLYKAIGELKNEPNIWIDETPAMTLQHIQSECRKIKRKIGSIGFIGVDYLTLMQTEKADRNDLAYGNITKGLKILAKELNTVVVLLTQLNRKLEDRANKRPIPSDSRDTGQIEQDCDYWLGVHREAFYDPNADKTLTELIVRLNRHGKTGTIYVDQKGLCIFPLDQHLAAAKSQPKKEPKRYSDKKF